MGYYGGAGFYQEYSWVSQVTVLQVGSLWTLYRPQHNLRTAYGSVLVDTSKYDST